MSENVNTLSAWARVPGRLRWFPLAVLLVVLCFSKALFNLARFALSDTLYSHILLIPFISAYLAWLQKDRLSSLSAQPPAGLARVQLAVGVLAVGVLALAAFWGLPEIGWTLGQADGLMLTTLAFVCVVIGVCGLFLSREALTVLAFPIGFLLFMVPFPAAVRDGMEYFLQHASAWATSVMFSIAGSPVLMDGLIIKLPENTLKVAPECSGIHSTWVLFMTSLLAGHMMLRSPWKRFWLALLVVPLAIARNGFRIFTLSELCIHIGPQMIDSPIHHKGGPIFFALSLIPFFILLYLMVKSERRAPHSRT